MSDKPDAPRSQRHEHPDSRPRRPWPLLDTLDLEYWRRRAPLTQRA
jgi:hypothetical protein